MPFFSVNFHEAIMLYMERLPGAILVTLMITFGALGIGTALGLVIALASLSPIKPLAVATRPIVVIGRCIPVPPFLYLIYFSALMLITIDAIQAGVLALGILLAPFMSELFRSGIKGVKRGQVEAGLALGMTSGLLYRRIILPIAVRIMFPILGQMAIGTLLNSAFVAVIGARDITGMSRNIINSLFTSELYLIVAVTYFLIAYPASRVLSAIDQRWRSMGLV